LHSSEPKILNTKLAQIGTCTNFEMMA